MKDIENALERHRTRLEASLEKLRKALQQWQTYSAEYEGLKEELQELPADASRESMVTLLSPGLGDHAAFLITEQKLD